jgi:Co/Zn/Cd efflux system component
MKRAFGALDLLIALVVMTFIFMISANVFKGAASINLNGAVDTKSIKQEVDKQVSEIENMRRQSIDLQKHQLGNE